MKVVLKDVILSMPYLFEPSAFDEKSDEKYSAHFLLEPNSPQVKLVKEAISAEATALWKDKAGAKLKAIAAAGKIWCLRDGDGKTDKEGEPINGYAGRMYVSAKNTLRPSAFDGLRQPVTAADGKLYPGAIVNAIIDVRVNNKPSDQAYAYLQGVQFVRDGERLGGGVVASAEDFELVKDTKAAHDHLADFEDDSAEVTGKPTKESLF
jgi:hypothetical protein